MNYFPFHVGDYAAATAHLTWDEDMAYTRLLRAYYLTEQPIPLDKAYRLARASTPAQRKAVDYVLSEFFSKTDSGYTQARCETEISAYREGDAEREQKNAHEKERMRRHRDRRSELFATLRAHEIIPAWDAPIKELQRLVDTCCNAPATRTGAFQDPYCNAPATATHNQNQEPITNNQIQGERVVIEEDARAISQAGEVCKAMKAAGMASVNPSSPKLASVLAAGITTAELAQAAADAVEQGKGFAYALAMAEGRRRDAVAPAKAPAKQAETFAERDARIGRERWEQMTGRTHPDNLKNTATHGGMVVDISPVKLEFQA